MAEEMKKEKKAKVVLDPKKDIPKNKSEITQIYMLYYVLENHPEDAEWYGKLCDDHTKQFKNNLSGEVYDGIDLKVVRNAFCEKYFPSLNVKKKYNEDKKSYLDLVRELCLKK